MILLWLAVAVAGGLGAVARLVLEGAVRAHTDGRYPVGTAVVNLTGSLLLGLVAGLAAAAALPPAVQLVAGTGFLGGYTTFSTASVETVRLAAARRPGAALTYGLGTLLATVAAAGLGLALGTALAGQATD